MCSWEEHAVNFRLFFPFLRWYEQLLTLKILFHYKFTLHKFPKEDLITVIINFTRHKPAARPFPMFEISKTHAPTATHEVADIGEDAIRGFSASLYKLRKLFNLLV